MKNPLIKLNYLLLLLGVITASAVSTFGQCSVVSTNGYTVHISITPVAILPDRNPCTSAPGYNYNVRYNYNITFTGTNIPTNLYTLQANIVCAGQNNSGYSIPTSGGSGTSTTTTNPWRPVADCNSVTVSICTAGQITIDGPGISSRTISCSPTLLPIKLVSFEGEATDNGIDLRWSTSMEENFDYFELERASENLDFQTISIIEGKGNLEALTSYRYTDRSLSSGEKYYRLKSIDRDGSFKYSNVIRVSWATVAKMISLYPNPVAGRTFNLEQTGDFSSSSRIVFLNSVGKVLFEQAVTNNIQQIQLPDNIQTGIYIAKVISPAGQKVFTVVVK